MEFLSPDQNALDQADGTFNFFEIGALTSRLQSFQTTFRLIVIRIQSLDQILDILMKTGDNI